MGDPRRRKGCLYSLAGEPSQPTVASCGAGVLQGVNHEVVTTPASMAGVNPSSETTTS